MKFVSFNINGLRARPHQLEAIVEKHQPDVIGLQETKVHDDMFPLEEVAKLGYNVFYHGQKGHYGVALLTKETPIAVRRGFPGDDEEAQRRIIMAEIPSLLGNVTVINGYFPQGESRDHPIKFPAKAQFYQNLQNYLETELKRDNPVLIMGDMNISPTDLDIAILLIIAVTSVAASQRGLPVSLAIIAVNSALLLSSSAAKRSTTA